MRKKLYYAVFIMLLLIILLFAGSQVIMSLYRQSGEKLIVEYYELHALQEYKMALTKLMLSSAAYDIDRNKYTQKELNLSIVHARGRKDKCIQVITKKHVDYKWEIGNLSLDKISAGILSQMSKDTIPGLVHFTDLNSVINETLSKLDTMIDETNMEIMQFEKKNRTINVHGTLTLVIVSVVFIILLSIGSFFFIRRITRPISSLVGILHRISQGENNLRVENFSDPEFNQLAKSFNQMLDTVSSTTVSAEYLHNIINNFNGFMLVTDKNGQIKIVNKHTIDMLGYSESEILSKNVLFFFTDVMNNQELNNKFQSLEDFTITLKDKSVIYSKDGHGIPVLTSCSILFNNYNVSEGFVIAGYDLTEKKAYERTIEKMRKDSLIAINEAQEVERMRIATDLHDGIGQMLTAISYSLQDIEGCDKPYANILEKIQVQVSAVIQETKNLAHDLIPILLKDFGLIAALKSFIDKANQVYETRFRFSYYDINERPDPRIEKTIYRICQESLNNIVKHSKAKNANIQLFGSQEKITMVIDDDGVGFDMEYLTMHNGTGIGIISIRERVLAFNGTFSIESRQGQGTELIIEIPCIKN